MEMFLNTFHRDNILLKLKIKSYCEKLVLTTLQLEFNEKCGPIDLNVTLILLIFCFENFVCSLGLLHTFRRASGKMLPCKHTLMSSLTRVHNVCNKGYVRKCT